MGLLKLNVKEKSTDFARYLSVSIRIIVLLFCGTAGAQNLSLPATGAWNSYNNQLNIVECSNISLEQGRFNLIIRSSAGTALNSKTFTILPRAAVHTVLGAAFTQDAYGTFLIEPFDEQSENLELVCHTAVYRLAADNAPKAVDYAFSIPVSNPLSGITAGVFSSMNPQPNAGPALNWLTVFNPGSDNFDAAINLYTLDGSLDEEHSFQIPHLAPGERRDFPLGHPQGQTIGLYRIIPNNNTAPYGAFLSRYGKNSAGEFRFAFALSAQTGVCDSGPLPASTMDPATNWAEIANPTEVPLTIEYEVRSQTGTLLKNASKTIAPFSQHHLLLNQFLGSRSVGQFRVKCANENSTSQKLLAASLFYGHLHAGAAEVEWAYASQARGVIAQAGDLVVSLFNTFHSAPNWHKYLNASSADTQTLTVTLYRENGALITDSEHRLPAGGVFDLGLHQFLENSVIGLALSQTNTEEAAFAGELLRVFPHKHAILGYVMSVPSAVIRTEEEQGEGGEGDDGDGDGDDRGGDDVDDDEAEEDPEDDSGGDDSGGDDNGEPPCDTPQCIAERNLAVQNINRLPTRIAEGPDGKLYVSDAKVGSVFIYDSTQVLQGELKNLDKPLGLAVDSQGNIYVGNNGRDNIEVYDAIGSKLFVIGEGEIQMPNDLAFDRQGNLYVVDSLAHTIRVYNSSGDFLRNIGGPGDAEEQLRFPVSLTISYGSGEQSSDELYVADQGHYKIKVFDLSGVFLREYGGEVPSFGSNWRGRFVTLQSLAVDGEGRVHAVDSYMNKIQVLNAATGEYLFHFGSFGQELGQLNLPLDILITHQGHVEITNAENHRIETVYQVVPQLAGSGG